MSALDLEALSARVMYEGSGHHKRHPNPLCPPTLRSDASACDDVDPKISDDPPRLTALLREALRRGQHDRRITGEFPRYIWGWIVLSNGEYGLFEARLTQSSAGTYHGTSSISIGTS
ncbi:MAG TPA: hypothetical protein VH165_01710 [Kofleriaceae bacterium]|jgi:hypothetical protein|nr:hypothetical protein [Kofleriaceae bacterium]